MAMTNYTNAAGLARWPAAGLAKLALGLVLAVGAIGPSPANATGTTRTGATNAGSAAGTANTTAWVQEGDIVFQTSRSAQSMAVQRATGSPYSHMGIVFMVQGKPQVFEAVATVQFTPLNQWIARGTESQFVAKRLKNSTRILTPAALQKLHIAARHFAGRPYDLTFEWSDSRIYCSELVWKMYDRALGIRIGGLQRIRDFNLTDPAVRTKMRERYGDHAPLDEPVISPVAMFDSPLLETVGKPH